MLTAQATMARTEDFVPPAPIRVCFMIDRLIVPGGTESQLLALIRSLDRTRIKPYLCLLEPVDRTWNVVTPEDCPVLELGSQSILRLRTVGAVRRLARFLGAERIDVLQLYFPDSTILGAIAGRLAGVRNIVRIRNNTNHWMTPMHRFLGRMLNRIVTVTLCNCEAAREAVLATEGPDPRSVIVIENGVDLERFDHISPVRPQPSPSLPRRIGMVANLRAVKGVDIFIQAAALVGANHPEVTFHVAGEGPELHELERRIAETGLAGSVFLQGRVNDIPDFLADVDIAVLSSRSEGMPNVILEYMAAGRPTIATAVGGVDQLIENNVSGLIVPPNDPRQLAQAISDLLCDSQRAAELGRAARSRAVTDFGREANTRRFERLFEALTKNASAIRLKNGAMSR